MNAVGDEAGEAPPFDLEALINTWLRCHDEWPGRLSPTRRVRLRQHLAVLPRMVDSARATSSRPGGGESVVLVDTGSGVLRLSEGSTDDLAVRLATAGYPSAARQRIAHTWRRFEHWVLEEHGRRPADELAGDPPVSFTQSEIVGLLEAARSPSPRQRDIWPVRDRAVLAVLFGVGPRSNELVGLRDHDLSRESCSLRVGSARTLKRWVPLSSAVATALDSYLMARPTSDADGVLFLRTDNRALSPRALRAVVRRGIVRVRPEMTGRDWVPAFRNTYVYWQLGHGVDVPAIASRLGLSPDELAAHVSGYDPTREVDLDAALDQTAP